MALIPVEASAAPWHPIDWRAPWLGPWREEGGQITEAMARGVPLCQALNEVGRSPVRFVPQAALAPGQAYEDFIFKQRCCPTRDGPHDFFNALCWMRFPQTKTRLNQLQAAEIAHAGVQTVRGPVRDALTVFDENAALLDAPQALWDALERKDWHRLFVDLRPHWQDARLLLFGHALLEKLLCPRKPITAHVYRAQLAIESIASVDKKLAEDLNPEVLRTKPFLPLPVLGVPGWWAENEDISFYDDPLVFRPPKLAGKR